MKKLYIIGAGGWGREVLILLRDHVDCGTAWDIAGFLVLMRDLGEDALVQLVLQLGEGSDPVVDQLEQGEHAETEE